MALPVAAPPSPPASHPASPWIQVPGRWEQREHLPIWQGQTGTGLYQLEIVLAETDVGKVLQLKSDLIATRFNCAINGQKVGHSGFRDPPASSSRLAYFEPFVAAQQHLHLRCEVENSGFNRGGIIEPLWLGLERDIEAQNQAPARKIVALGGVFLLLLYHLGIYFFRPASQLAFLFSLTAGCALIYFDLVNTHFAESLWGKADFDTSLRLLRLGLYGATIAFTRYFQVLFPEESPAWACRVLNQSMGVLVLWTLLTPMSWHAPSIALFWVIHLLQFMLWGSIVLRALKHRRHGAWIFMSSTLIYQGFALNDILFVLKLSPIGDTVIYGYFIFCLSQAWLLAQRFSESYFKAQQLSQDMAQLNAQLEQRVTERTATVEQQKQEIERLSQFKMRLTQMMVHDLKNPLGVILGQSELNKTSWQQIQTAAFKMRQLLLNFLDLQRFEEVGLKITPSDFAIKPLLTEIWAEQAFYTQRKNLQLQLNVATEQRLWGDRALFKRVLENLLNNAQRFAPPDSSITLQISDDKEGLKLSVCDQGPGFSAVAQQSAFVPFGFDAKLGNDIPSSGLGLAFCKWVVEAHQGRIGYQYTEKGTVVWLWLPQAALLPPPAAPAAMRTPVMLSQQVLEHLAPWLPVLQSLEVYQITRLQQALVSLQDTAAVHLRAELALWCQQLLNSCNAFDTAAYQEQLQSAVRALTPP